MRRPPLPRDERGLTLIELLVVIAILGLILAPLLTLMTQGTRSEAAAGRQFSQQEQAYRVLRRIVDGADQGSQPVPGLRQAIAVNTSGGLAYRAGNTVVTYYAAGGSLYRKTCDAGAPGCVLSPIDQTGGTAVLGDVQQFEAARSGRLVTLQLEVRSPGRGPGSGDTGVRLVTRVLVRNLP